LLVLCVIKLKLHQNLKSILTVTDTVKPSCLFEKLIYTVSHKTSHHNSRISWWIFTRIVPLETLYNVVIWRTDDVI